MIPWCFRIVFIGILFQLTLCNPHPKPDFGFSASVTNSASVKTAASSTMSITTQLKSTIAPLKITADPTLNATGVIIQQLYKNLGVPIADTMNTISSVVSNTMVTQIAAIYSNANTVISTLMSGGSTATTLASDLTTALGDTVGMKVSTSVATINQGISDLSTQFTNLNTAVTNALSDAGPGIPVSSTIVNNRITSTIISSLVSAITTIKTGATAFNTNLMDLVKGFNAAVTAGTTTNTSITSTNQTVLTTGKTTVIVATTTQTTSLLMAITTSNTNVQKSYTSLKSNLNKISSSSVAANITAYLANHDTYVASLQTSYQSIIDSVNTTLSTLAMNINNTFVTQANTIFTTAQTITTSISNSLVKRETNADTCAQSYGATKLSTVATSTINTKLSKCLDTGVMNIVAVVKLMLAQIESNAKVVSSGMANCVTLATSSSAAVTMSAGTTTSKAVVSNSGGTCIDIYSALAMTTSGSGTVADQVTNLMAFLSTEQMASITRVTSCLSQKTAEVTAYANGVQDAFTTCLTTGKVV